MAKEKEMNAQELIDVVTEELEKKYNPELQLEEFILRQKGYLNENRKNNSAQKESL